MSVNMIFVNGFVLIIVLFIIYCVVFRFRDAKFSFLNLLRHRRRTLSTICAIILGGVAIFLYGGFINYSFWILQHQQSAQTLVMYKFITRSTLILQTRVNISSIIMLL